MFKGDLYSTATEPLSGIRFENPVNQKCYKKACNIFEALTVFKNIKILSEVTTILDNVAVTAVTSLKKKRRRYPGGHF